jgi:hypothetical protein
MGDAYQISMLLYVQIANGKETKIMTNVLPQPNLAGGANFDPSAETLAHSDLVRYHTAEHPNPRDDILALQCRAPGDIVQLTTTPGEGGPAGLNGYGNVGPDGFGMAWIATSSGNRYGIAQGQILNMKTGELSRVDSAEVDIRVGGQVRVQSGAGSVETSDVSGVLLWQGDASSYDGSRNIDAADVKTSDRTPPFEDLWSITNSVQSRDPANTQQLIAQMQQARGFGTPA